MKKLEKVLGKAEEELVAQRKELHKVEEEKRILHSQLTKRDEELAKLYEQLKVQQSNLLHGENEYKAVCGCRGSFCSPPNNSAAVMSHHAWYASVITEVFVVVAALDYVFVRLPSPISPNRDVIRGNRGVDGGVSRRWSCSMCWCCTTQKSSTRTLTVRV